MSNAILAIVTAAQRANLNLAFNAMGRGPDTFSRAVCELDPEATWETPPTHYASYNAVADIADAAKFASAQAGTLPLDDAGDPVNWGEDGNPSEEDAIAAFAELQFWVNASDVEPLVFAEANLTAANLQFVPFQPL